MIPFVDLARQQERIRDRLDRAIARVLDHGQYVMGPEIAEFEDLLVRYCDVDDAISCGSGTDALLIALMAAGIGQGDSVLLPSFTFVASAEAVVLAGATPVFVDCDPNTYLIDCDQIRDALEANEHDCCAIIAVDLFGQPADYRELNSIAAENRLTLIADAAQSLGATQNSCPVGTLADISTTSFYPAKPLACYGEGGAILTNRSALAKVCRSVRIHGQETNRYDSVRLGINGRMDTLQATILIEKLAIFDDEISARQRIAQRYNDAFETLPVVTPKLLPGNTSVWSSYTIQVESRNDLVAHLKADSIPSAIYYRKPLHQQAPYKDYPVAPGGARNTEALCNKVLSLPMHGYLEDGEQDEVIDSVIQSFA